MTRILVAATSGIVRRGLETLLAASPNLTVVGSSSLDATTLAERLEDLQPDVVLLELRPQEDDSVARHLPAFGPGPGAPAIVVLADPPYGPWIAEALRSGVRAVLPPEAAPEEIVAAVEAAATGLVALHPDAVEALLPAAPASPRSMPAPPHPPLSSREVEVLGMLAEGLGNKQIAWRLGISEHTVKFHLSSIFTKLDVSSRTEAVALGVRLGLIML